MLYAGYFWDRLGSVVLESLFEASKECYFTQVYGTLFLGAISLQKACLATT